MSGPITLESFLCRLKVPSPALETERLEAMLAIEATLWAQGFTRIAGTDEAGRGPLAGPVVAAAVVLAAPVAGVNDSKRLSEGRREALYDEILAEGHAVGVSVKSAAEVDRHGIQRANMAAMLEAVAALPDTPDFVLVDGYQLSGLAQPALRVTKGDARSLSIAAASIIAKVTRDKMMIELDARYPGYGFARHKGYGTREHLAALTALGPCPEHRRSFAPLAQAIEAPPLL